MPKYLIEGSCDGGLFAETIEAVDDDAAEDQAIDRLCEAWGHTRIRDNTKDFATDLSDLGDSASVRKYDADDYARDAASDMLALLQSVEDDWGENFDGDEPMNGGDCCEWLCQFIEKARAVRAAASPPSAAIDHDPDQWPGGDVTGHPDFDKGAVA